MATGNFANVLVEPHQKHVTGQSDLETALHTLLDHLREPLMAIKGSATDFSHVFNRSFHLGAHKPRNVNGGYARIFAPRIDMRESSQAYYIDIELPGVHDASALTIVWRSDRELLVEGVVERPVIQDVLGLSARSDTHKNGTKGFAYESRDLEAGTTRAPAYVVADEANGFEKNEDFAPRPIPQSSQAGDMAYNATNANAFQKPNDPMSIQRKLREQANPFAPTTEDHSNGFEYNRSNTQDLFPLDIVDGRQLDEGDGHRVQVPMHHLPNGDEVNASQACVSIGERGVGRFMRCFVFPHGVDVQGLRSEMVDGLLRIGVPKREHTLGNGQRSAVGTVE